MSRSPDVVQQCRFLPIVHTAQPMPLRLYTPDAIAGPGEFTLPADAARHVQVRRLQPGDALVLFDGRGGEWQCEVQTMGRRDVVLRVLAHSPVEREIAPAVTIALGMPANDRMDALVEKAAELGMAALQPLHTTRSVLRLEAERAERRRAHWQAVAQSACEQCGRTRVPVVHPVRGFDEWLASAPDQAAAGWLLDPQAPRPVHAPAQPLLLLSGPEGGFTTAEREAALARGFVAVGLGPRVLRADTAPLAMLAWLAMQK
jgi:16S rRNA (uracil1498-N3)-methyltransferase